MPLPSHDTLRFLTASFARTLEGQREVFDAPELVLPTRAFFPDEVDVSPEGIDTLLRRLVTYTPLSADIALQIAFIEPASAEAKSCSSGACGPSASATSLLVPTLRSATATGGYDLPLDVSLVRNPVRLTTSLARSVAGTILLEAGAANGVREDFAVQAEIMAHLTGFGTLLLAGSNLFLKGCGGVKRLRGTELNTDDHAFLLAMFASVFGHALAPARKLLEPTQREALELAAEFVAEHEPTFHALRDNPALFADGCFEFERRAGFFTRLFGRSRPVPDPAPVTPVVRSASAQARLQQARRLMEDDDDSMSKGAASAQ